MDNSVQPTPLNYGRDEPLRLPIWACTLVALCLFFLPFPLRLLSESKVELGAICCVAGLLLISWIGRPLRPRTFKSILIIPLLLLCFPTFILGRVYQRLNPDGLNTLGPSTSLADFGKWGAPIIAVAAAIFAWVFLKKSIEGSSRPLRILLLWILMPIVLLLAFGDGAAHVLFASLDRGGQYATVESPDGKYRVIVYVRAFRAVDYEAFLERNSIFALTSRKLAYDAQEPAPYHVSFRLDQYGPNVLCLWEDGNPVGGWNLDPFDQIPDQQLGYLIVRDELANSSKIDLNHLPEYGKGTAVLIRAIELDDQACAKALLDQGVSTSANSFGNLPLLAATEHSNLSMIRLLVEHGADVNAVDQMGTTALMCAAKNGSANEVSYLLAHGAKANLLDKSGNTALSLARQQNRTEAVELLSR